MWGWYVKIESVQLSEDGRTAVLTTEPLYQGRYNVTLNKVASRMTPANVSARQQSCSFMIARWPRDRAFYMGRFSMPLTIAVVLLGALALNWLVLRRRERVSEQTAEAEHLLAGADSLDGTGRTAQALGYTVLGCARLHCREPLGGHCGKQPDLGQRRRPVRPLPAGQPHPPPARRAGRAGRSPCWCSPLALIRRCLSTVRRSPGNTVCRITIPCVWDARRYAWCCERRKQKKLTKCASGHFYDADKYPECPYCNTGLQTDPSIVRSGAAEESRKRPR